MPRRLALRLRRRRVASAWDALFSLLPLLRYPGLRRLRTTFAALAVWRGAQRLALSRRRFGFVEPLACRGRLCRLSARNVTLAVRGHVIDWLTFTCARRGLPHFLPNTARSLHRAAHIVITH
jgi:hypothetical protein